MSWSITHYDEKYAINPHASTACLLIPGWGVTSDIFEWLLPALSQDFCVYRADVESYVDMASAASPVAVSAQLLAEKMAETIEQPCWIIGWSLGGNIALQLAADFPEKVLGLCIIASSPSFVARDHWPHAMAEETFNHFAQGIIKTPKKTLKRFDLLQCQGDDEHKNLAHALGEYRKQQYSAVDMDANELAAGLQLLADFDQVSILPQIQQPLLFCLGEEDALIHSVIKAPLEAIAREAQIPMQVKVFEGASHLPFLTKTDDFFHAFKTYLESYKQAEVNEKKKVAASFSKAATSYDDAAALQQWVAKSLLDRLDVDPNAILLDAGCGTGYWTRQISAKVNRVIGLDMAEGMLHFAEKNSTAQHKPLWCGGDLENLPLADNSVDVIFSSLAVQWCESLTPLLNEWFRVLKPGGKVLLATLGPKTLFELRESFQTVDNYQHVNQFISSDILCQQITDSPLSLLQLQRENKVMRYQTIKALMSDLKNIGAQTVLSQQGKTGVKGLMGKKRFVTAQQRYESHRDIAGFLPATYEVIYFQLQKN